MKKWSAVIFSLFIIGCGKGADSNNSATKLTDNSYEDGKNFLDKRQHAINTDETTNLNSTVNDASTIQLTRIDLLQAVANNEVEGYDETKNGTPAVKDNYLAVINYFRSLPIVCNDDEANSGPVEPLMWSSKLQNAAKLHSDDMLKNNYFDHIGLDGSTPDQRILLYKEDATATGENISYRSSTLPIANDAWLTAMQGLIRSTQGHCSNIMHPLFRYFGMAEAKNTTADSSGFYNAYWTQSFSN